MKKLVSLVILLALALAGAWLWHVLASDPGYVLVALHGYSIETTLVVAVAVLLAFWLLAWIALVLVRWPWRYWRWHRRHSSRENLARGLVALHEGRWQRAEKLLRRAAREPQQRLPALLSAARAAQQYGNDAASSELLTQAAQEHDPTSVALLAARQHHRRGEAAAITALFDSEPIAALPPRALDLYLGALCDTGRAAEAVALLPSLHASQVRSGPAMNQREAEIIATAMQQATRAEALDSLWNGLSRKQRVHATIVAAYARQALTLDQSEAGINAIEKALRKHWSSELVDIYGLLPRGEKHSPLKMAEAWLKDHPDDPELLVTLGRLCRNEHIWGKAEEYLDQALAHGAGAAAWEEFGHLHAARQETDQASAAYAKALALQRGDDGAAPITASVAALPTATITPEVRSSMGVPLLELDEGEETHPDRY